jgi:hypothetical protein
MSLTAFDQPFAPKPGARQIDARPRGVMAGAAIGGGAMFALVLALLFTARAPITEEAAAPVAPQTAAAPPQPARPAPAPVAKKFASFDLQAPEFAKEPKSFTERSLDAGGREESVIIGQFAQGGPFLRLDLVMAGGDKAPASDFFLDMKRHAQQAGLDASRIGAPSPVPTRFGAFETADIRLSTEAGEERACLAARFLNGKAPLGMAGLICGAAAHPIDRRALACILDRLDYLSNGENKALDQFFLSAELDRGKGCAGAGAMAPTAQPKGQSWLDGHAIAPPLKKAAPAAAPTPSVKRRKVEG